MCGWFRILVDSQLPPSRWSDSLSLSSLAHSIIIIIINNRKNLRTPAGNQKHRPDNDLVSQPAGDNYSQGSAPLNLILTVRGDLEGGTDGSHDGEHLVLDSSMSGGDERASRGEMQDVDSQALRRREQAEDRRCDRGCTMKPFVRST